MARAKTITKAESRNSELHGIDSQFEALGRKAGGDEMARIDACTLFAKLYHTGKLPMTAEKGTKAFTEALKAIATGRAMAFLEAKASVSGIKASAATAKTYAAHYVCFTNQAVYENTKKMLETVRAYTSARTKTQMHKKGFFDVAYQMASAAKTRAEKGEAYVPVTAALIAKTIKPGTPRAGKDGGKKKAADVVAIDALKSAVAAALTDATWAPAMLKKLQAVAKGLGIAE